VEETTFIAGRIASTETASTFGARRFALVNNQPISFTNGPFACQSFLPLRTPPTFGIARQWAARKMVEGALPIPLKRSCL